MYRIFFLAILLYAFPAGAVNWTFPDNVAIQGTLSVTGAPTFTDNTINGADLVDSTVTSAKIIDNTIVDADINSAANIAGSKLLDNTIASAKLLDNTIALGKIAVTGTASSSTFLRGDAAWTVATQAALSAYKNLKITTPADNQSVTITADKVVVIDNTDVQRILSSVSLTVDLDVADVNGLASGTLAANTEYFLYIIDNGATTAGLASTSATAPTMPSGYTYKALIGWCTTDNTATPFNIEEFTQIDDVYKWKVTQAAFSTSSTSPVAVNLAAGGALTYAIVPPSITKRVFGRTSFASGTHSIWMDPETYSDGATTEVNISGAVGIGAIFTVTIIENQAFYIHVDSYSQTGSISGFILKR